MSIGTFLVYASCALFLFTSIVNVLCLFTSVCQPAASTPGQMVTSDFLITGLLFLLARSWHDEDRKY